MSHKYPLESKVFVKSNVQDHEIQRSGKVVGLYLKGHCKSEYKIELDGDPKIGFKTVYCREEDLCRVEAIKAYCFQLKSGDLVWRTNKDKPKGQIRRQELDIEKEIYL